MNISYYDELASNVGQYQDSKYRQRVEDERIETSIDFNIIKSSGHHINTSKVKKTCISCYDDKRFVLENGIQTRAYGHYLNQLMN